MAYPNYMAPYQPTPTPMPTYSAPQTGTDIIWVQGIAGAKAYPVAAGRSAQLMDSEDSLFYIKTTDASGMPQPLRIFKYEEISEGAAQTPQIDTSDFVTKDELDDAIDYLKKLVKEASKSGTSYTRRSSNGKSAISRDDDEE